MLHIRYIGAKEFSVSLLSKLLPFLRESTTLKSLKIKFAGSDIRMKPNPCVATSCLAILTALRGDSSLETLEIYGDHGIARTTYLTALEIVQKLCLSLVLNSFGEEEMQRVVSLVKKNFSLALLDEYVSAGDETAELGTILRLNRAGRCYLIDDAGSIAKGIKVLIDVRDDLNCLFYHLLENPMICDIELQYVQPGVPPSKSGSRSTKRA
jgi:hypothetical protein